MKLFIFNKESMNIRTDRGEVYFLTFPVRMINTGLVKTFYVKSSRAYVDEMVIAQIEKVSPDPFKDCTITDYAAKEILDDVLGFIIDYTLCENESEALSYIEEWELPEGYFIGCL